MTLHDPLNAFCRHTHVALDGSGAGPLTGLTVGVKDVYDIAGHRTGNGNPVWLETHPPAERTASSVQRLLDAGARMAGKTHTTAAAAALSRAAATKSCPSRRSPFTAKKSSPERTVRESIE